MKHAHVTIKDIAKIAGVSYSTVSRSLNDSPLVSGKTKRKVAEIASDMDFEFNASARGLITSQVGTIGIVLPEMYTEISVNVYHGMLMNNLRTSLEKADVDLIVTYLRNHFNGNNNVIRLVTRRKIDGLILLVEDIDKETLSFLNKRRFPFICTHYPPAGNVQNEDVIYTDHVSGGRQVAEYLWSLGRRRFILLAVEEEHLEFQMRETGFREVIEREGGEIIRLTTDTSVDASYREVLESFDQIKQYDALFALNDLMAIGAITALEEKGLNVPDDISVVGYDDSEYGRYFSPSITSIHQPREELAVMSCDRLFFQMEKKKAGLEVLNKLISIQPKLVIRESS